MYENGLGDDFRFVVDLSSHRNASDEYRRNYMNKVQQFNYCFRSYSVALEARFKRRSK